MKSPCFNLLRKEITPPFPADNPAARGFGYKSRVLKGPTQKILSPTPAQEGITPSSLALTRIDRVTRKSPKAKKKKSITIGVLRENGWYLTNFRILCQVKPDRPDELGD